MACDWLVSRPFVLRFRLMAVMLVSLASACPGDDASNVPDEGTSGTTAADTNTGEDASGTADGGSSGIGPATCEAMNDPIASMPSVLFVRVEILNDTAEPVYVAGSADGCVAYALARNGQDLPIGPDSSCPCECPESTTSVDVVALQPGASFELVWDGRVKSSYQHFSFCAEDQSCGSESRSALLPVEPGPITMMIPIYEEAGPYEESGYGGICYSPLQFSVDFELGSEELIVPVALSEVVIG